MNKLEKEEWKFIFLLLKVVLVGLLFVWYGHHMEKKTDNKTMEAFYDGIGYAIENTSIESVDIESGEVALNINGNDYIYYYYTK